MDGSKYRDYYLLLNHWLESKYYGHNAAEYFYKKNVHEIAIYGMGDLANRLMDDLYESKVHVLYGIDGDVSVSLGRIAEIYTLSDDLPHVEMIVITPFHNFDVIIKGLNEKIKSEFVSIEEVIWSI